MEIIASAAELHAAVGREIGPGEWFTIAQDRVDGFAEVTEDRQWIHVDPERAAGGPFGGTIAHGFLTLSLLPELANGVRRFENVAMGINYGLDRVRFPTPVRTGSRVRARLTVTNVDDLVDGGCQLTSRIAVEVEGAPKPACIADMVSRTYFSDGA